MRRSITFSVHGHQDGVTRMDVDVHSYDLEGNYKGLSNAFDHVVLDVNMLVGDDDIRAWIPRVARAVARAMEDRLNEAIEQGQGKLPLESPTRYTK